MTKPYKVLLDPGHGGEDFGAVAILPEVIEKEINLNVARYIKKYARREGLLFSARLTRFRDRFVSLDHRVRKIRKKNPDIFVSLHCNSFSDTDVTGVEVFFKPDCTQSRHAARNILDHLLDAMPGHKRRGEKPGDLYVLRNSPVPAVLVEYEFLSNPQMASYLYNDEIQKLLARTTAEAIEYYLEGGAILE